MISAIATLHNKAYYNCREDRYDNGESLLIKSMHWWRAFIGHVLNLCSRDCISMQIRPERGKGHTPARRRVYTG